MTKYHFKKFVDCLILFGIIVLFRIFNCLINRWLNQFIWACLIVDLFYDLDPGSEISSYFFILKELTYSLYTPFMYSVIIASLYIYPNRNLSFF